jgi:hypothetical protein
VARGPRGREGGRDREREVLLTIKKGLKIGEHNALSGNTAPGRTGSSNDGEYSKRRVGVEYASEKKRAEARRGQGQCRGEAGDGARELLLWTANPGAQKHFDPEHPLAGDSKGSSLALVLYFLV